MNVNGCSARTIPAIVPAMALVSEMTDQPTIEIISGRPMTTSLAVAEFTGKRHDNVLRDIGRLIASKKFAALNFEEMSYKDINSQARKAYRMDRHFTAILMMGMTGEKALDWKIAYDVAFENAVTTLHQSQVAPMSDQELMAKALVVANKTLAAMQGRLAQLEHTLAEQAPAVEYHDRVMRADGCHDMSEAAAIFRCSRPALFKRLRELNVFPERSRIPYIEYQRRDYFRIVQTVYLDHAGVERVSPKTIVTPAGMRFIKLMLDNLDMPNAGRPKNTNILAFPSQEEQDKPNEI